MKNENEEEENESKVFVDEEKQIHDNYNKVPLPEKIENIFNNLDYHKISMLK